MGGGAVCRGCFAVQKSSQRYLICGAGSDDDASDDDRTEDNVSDGGGDADEQHQQPAFNAAGSNALEELQSAQWGEELHLEAEQQLEAEVGSDSEELRQQLNLAEEGAEHGEPGSDTGAAALPPTRCVPPAATHGRRGSKECPHWCDMMSGAGLAACARRLRNWPRVHTSCPATAPGPVRQRNHGAGAPALYACACVSLMCPCISRVPEWGLRGCALVAGWRSAN